MNFREFAKENIVILDGGMGTILQSRGLKPGEAPEIWNATKPEEIVNIHKAYFAAGSNVIYTATFGVNGLKYSHSEIEAIIQCAIDNARKAKSESEKAFYLQEKFIALDISSLGRMLKPYGDLEFEKAVSLFKEVIEIGVDYGVDLIAIETMNDSYETKAAVIAAKETTDLPIIVTNAYGEDGKLLTGASAKAMVAILEGLGVDYIGANCSLGPSEMVPIIRDMLSVSSTPIVIKPNAGLPRVSDGNTVYDFDSDDFSETVIKLVKEGACLVGGCCGTTPEYIQKISRGLRGYIKKDIEPKDLTVISSYTNPVYFNEKPVLIGERLNPTGKKRYKEALVNQDYSYILEEGVKEEEEGAEVLDLNVGLPEIDEEKVMEDVLFNLQSVVNVPFVIDTGNYMAMEKALRFVNGKAMVNSVNGKTETMEKVFPLVKKYGGVVVCLTLDENGIPETAYGRVAIAKRIIEKAKEYGLSKKDLIFDTLTMTLATNKDAGKVTLDALKMIHDDLGCKTILGVSNISFGLPNREILNANFFKSAAELGLNGAIINPYSMELKKAYYSHLLIHGHDENAIKYLEFSKEYEKCYEENQSSVDNKKKSKKIGSESKGSKSELSYAIEKGFKEKARTIAADLLKTKKTEPLSLIENEVIPALDNVGIGFENKEIYLPELLMAAEAAKAVFDEVKSKFNNAEKPKKDKIVIATVQGDIHDIGKNICKLILENYGYDVIDLGKDVKPEKIVETIKTTGARFVGLSALMTTTVPKMEETIRLIKSNDLDVITIVGGAVLNPDYAKKIGADYYSKNAMENVRIIENL